MKVGIVIFPGSNCDYDAYQAFKMNDGVEVDYLWHGSSDLKSSDVVPPLNSLDTNMLRQFYDYLIRVGKDFFSTV